MNKSLVEYIGPISNIDIIEDVIVDQMSSKKVGSVIIVGDTEDSIVKSSIVSLLHSYYVNGSNDNPAIDIVHESKAYIDRFIKNSDLSNNSPSLFLYEYVNDVHLYMELYHILQIGCVCVFPVRMGFDCDTLSVFTYLSHGVLGTRSPVFDYYNLHVRTNVEDIFKKNIGLIVRLKTYAGKGSLISEVYGKDCNDKYVLLYTRDK